MKADIVIVGGSAIVFSSPLSLDRFFFVWPFSSVYHQYHGCNSSLCWSQNLHHTLRGVNNCKSHLPIVLMISLCVECQCQTCGGKDKTSLSLKKESVVQGDIILISVLVLWLCISKYFVGAIIMLRFNLLLIQSKKKRLQQMTADTHESMVTFCMKISKVMSVCLIV